MLVLPAFGDLVVTITTPFAPRAPYIAVDEASFKTSIDSISVTAISLILSTIKPSTIYNGELSWVIEPPPRTRTTISAPGAPSTVVTWTPGNRPVKASATLITGAFSRSRPFTELTAPAKSLRDTGPDPMTTASSSALDDSCEVTMSWLLAGMLFSVSKKPMNEKTNISSFDDTSILN